MAMNFANTRSKAMVDNVMGKVNDTELDNKKKDIPVDLIDLNVDNEEIFGYEEIEHLAQRMEENGFYGAIEVYAKKDGRYEIASGHRRYLAYKSLGKDKIPCIVSADVDDVAKAKHLIEGNIHNRTMTPFKWAKAIDYYDKKVISETLKPGSYGTNFNKRKELAKVFNISESAVKRYTQILKLIPEFQELTKSPNFPYTNIIELAQYSKEDQLKIYKRLSEVAEDGNIATLSKSIITKMATGVVETIRDDDGRKNKANYSSVLKDERKEEKNVGKEDAVTPIEDQIKDEPAAPSRNYENEDDVSYFDSSTVEEDEDTEDTSIHTDKDTSYERAIYFANQISNFKESISGWTKEEKKKLKSSLEEIVKML